MLPTSKETTPQIVFLIIIFFAFHISGYSIIERRRHKSVNDNYDYHDSREESQSKRGSENKTKSENGTKQIDTNYPALPVTECRSLTNLEKEKLKVFGKCPVAGSFPIKNECKIYLHCIRPGVPAMKGCCPLGLHFDHFRKTCIRISKARCLIGQHKRSIDESQENDDDDYKSDENSSDESDEKEVESDEKEDNGHVNIPLHPHDQMNFYHVPVDQFPWTKVPYSKPSASAKYMAIPVVITFGNLPPTPETSINSHIHLPGLYEGMGQYQGQHAPGGQHHHRTAIGDDNEHENHLKKKHGVKVPLYPADGQ